MEGPKTPLEDLVPLVGAPVLPGNSNLDLHRPLGKSTALPTQKRHAACGTVLQGVDRFCNWRVASGHTQLFFLPGFVLRPAPRCEVEA